MKRKILLVIGTRPEAVKMAPLVHALQREPWADCRVLVTAQHRALLDPMLDFFGITAHLDLDLMRPGQSLADLSARAIAALDPVLAAEQPDLVVAQGDTTTVLAAALCAFWRRVPFAHLEAGLRSHDLAQPFPEEANRILADRLAALHFAPSETARQNLRREGLPDSGIHVVGNTVVDALLWAAPRVNAAEFTPPPGRHLVLVTAHRRESFGAPLARICDALGQLADRSDVHLLFPLHPNPEVQAVVRHRLGGRPHCQLAAPLSYPQMLAAMQASRFILTDSGGVQEEAPSLRRPVLVMRERTERPELLASGHARLVGTTTAAIVAAAAHLLSSDEACRAMTAAPNPYGTGQTAEAVTQVLRERWVGDRAS